MRQMTSGAELLIIYTYNLEFHLYRKNCLAYIFLLFRDQLYEYNLLSPKQDFMALYLDV
jgi:hypothetical protein